MAAFNARGQNLDPELGNIAHSAHPAPSDPPPSYQNTISNPPPIYHPPNSSSTPNRSANSRDPFQNHSRTSSNNSRDPFSSNYSRTTTPNPPRDPFAYRTYRNDHDMLMDHFKATQATDRRREQVINGPDKSKQKKALGKYLLYFVVFIVCLTAGLGIVHGIKNGKTQAGDDQTSKHSGGNCEDGFQNHEITAKPIIMCPFAALSIDDGKRVAKIEGSHSHRKIGRDTGQTKEDPKNNRLTVKLTKEEADAKVLTPLWRG
ncbi:hypothetical protein BGZ60DRAFT_564134 [Tricladium varicosporioides]|nr:hypothetical protein BGZ60DRAFT_564134 [Hymenoscyphus varicosporioides]